ncbi:MAG: four-carbon acid sugar kinase family protein [Fusobacteriaceae bacterium]|jgi:uncharacterized protein YgbK (DUF1537 family)|nr:four-carbon acid sugar kinase family protein [Fusobacteriaceae bacterium]
MIRLIIIADDFTGALDTGVQFSKKGISTLVTTNMNIELENIKDQIEVLVFDTESRHDTKNIAFYKVEKLVKRFKNIKNCYFYKKTDSTLRGNISGELAGFIEGLGINEISFIPALPQNGRTTKDGYHYVNDILLENSIFAKDPLNPTRESYIPKIINFQNDFECEIYKKSNFFDFTDIVSSEKKINIFDCVSNKDLIEIGNLLKGKNKLKYTSGCAGFAEILSDLIEFNKEKISLKISNDKLLMVCGSVNQVSLEQTKYAKNNGYKFYTLSPYEELSTDFINSENYKKLLDNISQNIDKNKRFLIESLDSYEKIKLTQSFASKNNISLDNLGIKIADNIGYLVKDIIDNIKLKNLVVFGGDTLIGIMSKLECEGIIPLDEILPGVVIARVISKIDYYNINIITKAGGFGNVDVINNIEKFIDKKKE